MVGPDNIQKIPDKNTYRRRWYREFSGPATYLLSIMTLKSNRCKSSQAFILMDNKLIANLAKLETTIMEIKQFKYARDLQDYKMTMYTWSKGENKNFTPKSILKKLGYVNHSNTQKHKPYVVCVNFGSTEADSSDTASEMEGQGNAINNSNAGNTPFAMSNREPQQTLRSKNNASVWNTNPSSTKRQLRSNVSWICPQRFCRMTNFLFCPWDWHLHRLITSILLALFWIKNWFLRQLTVKKHSLHDQGVVNDSQSIYTDNIDTIDSALPSHTALNTTNVNYNVFCRDQIAMCEL